MLSAQLSAQSAAIQQEREALISQRLSTDMLASLSEQVGRATGMAAVCSPLSMGDEMKHMRRVCHASALSCIVWAVACSNSALPWGPCCCRFGVPPA